MAIAAELLNNQLVAFEVHTGVFKNRHGKIAIVVRVTKDGKIAYLTLTESCRIELIVMHRDQFLREFNIELYHYPVMRAVRKYATYVRKENVPISDEARKIINSILVRS